MIFYFTGTGNSLQVAKGIADYSGEKLISIAKEINRVDGGVEYTLGDGEIIGFVFPVYAWSAPEMVIQFIKRVKFNNYNNNYIFAAATCGDNVGNTMKVLNKHLKGKGMGLNSGFSIRMPNNYIIGYDVDPKELEKEKLLKAEKTIKDISELIMERRDGIFRIEKGPVPFVLTSIINPIFSKMGMDTKKFYANDRCNGCGLCEKVCNSRTIEVDKKPKWGKECTQCFACIHICPVGAIQYGGGTEKKGRYRNPNVSVSELQK
jgi:ferredoxin